MNKKKNTKTKKIHIHTIRIDAALVILCVFLDTCNGCKQMAAYSNENVNDEIQRG